MAWNARVATLAALLVISACGETSRDKQLPAASPEDAGDASPEDAGDASPEDAGDASDDASDPIDPTLCRVQGYGIGTVDDLQCDAMHLMAHIADACISSGGAPNGARYVGEACEFQTTCCYSDDLPPLESLAAPSTGGTFTLLLAGDETSTRDLLLIAAEEACAVDAPGSRLSDWIVYYAADGATPEALRYYCVPARP